MSEVVSEVSSVTDYIGIIATVGYLMLKLCLSIPWSAIDQSGGYHLFTCYCVVQGLRFRLWLMTADCMLQRCLLQSAHI